jgi:hypothetical protein
MAGPIRLRSIARLVLAATLALGVVGGSASMPGASALALSRWSGGVDLYRSGVFTTQKTWLWCTAADVQIIRNIVDRTADHSRANQQRYFDYMRAHNRYTIPVSDGVDPAGWAAGLRHYVDSRYRLVASRSFDAALRSAVTNLRKTNLPVAITVSHGNHAWILTGFTATADPATTTKFSVTSVRVVGPLWGLQNRTYGYDMRPDRKLTPSQLKGFFTPWHYARVRMAWEGEWVSAQPIAIAGATPKPTAKPAPVVVATVRPTAAPTPTATPSPSSSATLLPVAVAQPSPTIGVALLGVVASVRPQSDPATSVAAASAGGDRAVSLAAGSAAFVAALALVALIGVRALRVRSRRPAR